MSTFLLYMILQWNMQIMGTRLETKHINNIGRSQYSPSEALELLGCSALSPDPPGLLLPLSQAEKESRNNLLSHRSQNLVATGWIITLILINSKNGLLEGKKMGYWYLRYYCVGWHYVFYFFGPGIYKTKPLTLQGDERAIFRFELIAICLNLLFTPQNCKKQQPKWHIKGIVHPKIFNPIWLFISDRTKNNDHIFAYNESKWGSRLSSSEQKAVNITCVIFIHSLFGRVVSTVNISSFILSKEERNLYRTGITQAWVKQWCISHETQKRY